MNTVFDEKNSSNRFFLLDLLRFIACLAVIFWHYRHFYYVEPGTVIPGFLKSAQPFYRFFSFFYDYGHYGVQLFWALSGFVFFALFAGKIYAKELSARAFFTDRFSRLYPLHLLSLLSVAFLVWLLKSATGNYGIYKYNDPYHFITNLFLVPYILPGEGWSFNAPVWSLTMEMIFYIVFFLYARFAKVDLIKTPVLTLIFFFAAEYPDKLILNPQIYRCGLFFFGGGTVFLLLRKLSEYFKIRHIYAASLVMFVMTACFFRHELPIILFLVLLFSCPIDIPKKLSAVFLFLGNLTYGVYMLHITVQLSMIYVCRAFLGFNLYDHARSRVCFVVYTVLLFMISILSYRYFEYPLKKLIRRGFAPDKDGRDR